MFSMRDSGTKEVSHELGHNRRPYGVRGQAQRDPALVSRRAAHGKAPSPLRSAGALHSAAGPFGIFGHALKRYGLALLACGLSGAGAFAQLVSPTPPKSTAPSNAAVPSPVVLKPNASLVAKASDGPGLARVFCASCHLFPEPDLLDKKTWREGTLPRMKIRLGLAPEMIDQHREAKLLRASGVFPTAPMLSEAEWKLIEAYYLASAPEAALPQGPRPEIQTGLKLFAPERPRFKRANPSTSMVVIQPKTHQIYMGDAETKSLDILDAAGGLLKSIGLGNVPVSIAESERGLYVTLIGHFLPSEDPKGEFVFLEKSEGRFKPPKVILKELPRPTHVEFADLNRDGQQDFVMALFGNNAGRLSWFENVGKDQYKEHVILPKPGALRTVVRDFNADGAPDIAVLMAQDLETLFLLFNDGKGNFTPQPVFQKPPVYGHSHFELADFDRDGRPDILATNGDNGEYASPLKRYHGVRIYLNKGGQKFEESFFFPLNGAYKAVARDFDRDGDLDIAAISFFPDYERSPQESFVYLENQGGLKFAPSTFPQFFTGRWLTMDADDLDGDGDIDIVLGSHIHGPSDVPDSLMQLWEKVGPCVLVLKNQLR
jgi:hypothetical protein